MKNNLITLIAIVATGFANAQNPLSQKVQTEFGLGISLPFLNSGNELIRSKNIRKAELSYFQNSSENRKNVGSYSRLIGWSIATAYYKPIKKIKGLMIGSDFRASLTGSEPSKEGYAEGYFFNFMSIDLGLKYYPFTKNNLFFKGGFGMATVLTKNRFINDQNQQNFFHQFGVGSNASFSIGYSITPFKNKDKAFDLQAVYQLNSTHVEVNGIGNDQWSFTALNFMLSTNF